MMVEVGVGVKEPTLSPEREARLEGDRQLTEKVASLIEEGNTSLYCETKARLPQLGLTKAYEWHEHRVKIFPFGLENEKKPPQSWFEGEIVVQIISQHEGEVRQRHLLVDFSERKEREKKSQFWVYSVNPEGEPDPQANHAKTTKEALEVLNKSIPLDEIEEHTKAIGFNKIFDEIPADLKPEHQDKLLEEPAETFTELKTKRPVLARLVAQGIAKELGEKRRKEGQDLAEDSKWKLLEKTYSETPVLAQIVTDYFFDKMIEEVGFDKVLDHRLAEVLKSEKVWKDALTVYKIVSRCVGALKESGLEKEALDTHPITKFLKERLGKSDCYVLFAKEGLFAKLPPPEIARVLVGAGEEVGAKRVSERITKILGWSGMTIGAAVELSAFYNKTLSEIGKGLTLPSGLQDGLVYGGATFALLNGLVAILGMGALQRRFEQAQTRAKILTENVESRPEGLTQ